MRSLDAFQQLYETHGPGHALTLALKKRFVLYQGVGRDRRGKVVCTGYYEPELTGAPDRTERFCRPLYARPQDLIHVDLGRFHKDLAGKTIQGRLEGLMLKPYYTRREIDTDGVLEGRGLEILWVDDPVALFFLHIQGSGRVVLPDGRVVRAGFSASNGQPYKSIGQHMLAAGLISRKKMSMPAIRDWLSAHPDQAEEIMNLNERYVFFRLLKGEVLGNINVPLTPHRSVALDHRLFPKGALAWLASRKPRVENGRIKAWQSLNRFVMVQDTGGAIQGPGRLDLFYGHGPQSEIAAGSTKEPGRLYFPVLKQ